MTQIESEQMTYLFSKLARLKKAYYQLCYASQKTKIEKEINRIERQIENSKKYLDKKYTDKTELHFA